MVLRIVSLCKKKVWNLSLAAKNRRYRLLLSVYRRTKSTIFKGVVVFCWDLLLCVFPYCRFFQYVQQFLFVGIVLSIILMVSCRLLFGLFSSFLSHSAVAAICWIFSELGQFLISWQYRRSCCCWSFSPYTEYLLIGNVNDGVVYTIKTIWF